MKGLVLIIVLALINITLAVSYPSWCESVVIVLAEEEERSSENAEEEIANHLSDYIVLSDEIEYTPCPSTGQKSLVAQIQLFLSPGMFNIHDIPPEA